jgi:hypothetical protein
MLRNLVNGVYDDVDALLGEQHWQPGELGGDAPASRPAPVSITVAVGGPPPVLEAPAPAPAPPAGRAAGLAAPAEAGRAWADAGPTIIGEDLISEKSLDEVILSYLAEDQAEKK